MSRGHGSVQREILAELARLPDGSLLLVGDGGPAYRRAAHRLAAEGRVSLVVVNRYGKRRLGVRSLSVLDRLLQRRGARAASPV